jgi:hypothetical protein
LVKGLISRTGQAFTKILPDRLFSFQGATSEETVLELMSSDKSLIRWGDGETGILMFQSLTFQKFDIRLWFGLLAVFIEGVLKDRFLFAIPFAALQRKSNLDSLNLWPQWYPTRLLFGFIAAIFPFTKRRVFHESHLFRGHEGFGKDWRIEDPTPLMRGRTLTYVGNVDSFNRFQRAVVGAASISFIEFPASQGFSDYRRTARECSIALDQGCDLLVLACGPTAKLLARRYSKNVRVLDLGHWQDFASHERDGH